MGFFCDEMLFSRDVGQVYVGERTGNGVYGCRMSLVVQLSREGVGDNVVDSGDVCNVRRELADQGELVVLSI